MTIPNVDWNKAFEFTWRILVFIVAIGIIIIVSTNWTRWEGGAGWQTTNDAYLQADLTPISAKVGGYLSELPVATMSVYTKGQLLAQISQDDYRAAVDQARASLASAKAQSEALKAQQTLQLATIEAARAVVASTTASARSKSARSGAAAAPAANRLLIGGGEREARHDARAADRTASHRTGLRRLRPSVSWASSRRSSRRAKPQLQRRRPPLRSPN